MDSKRLKTIFIRRRRFTKRSLFLSVGLLCIFFLTKSFILLSFINFAFFDSFG